jgi:LemA protein
MAVSAEGIQDQAQAENMLTGALKSLFAVSEAYPDLKANQNFLNLQEELTGTEGRIAYARQFYNDTVLRYNTKIQTFPAVILAGMFRFTAREYFEAEPESRENVQVSFDTPPSVAATPPAAPAPAPAAPAAPAAPPAAPAAPTDPPPPMPPTDPGTPPPA